MECENLQEKEGERREIKGEKDKEMERRKNR